MKITPLEIRQKAFNKSLRGYDKEEVEAFLTSLSSEWEKMIDQQKVLTLKVSSLEREVDKMRQVENTLFKTLKTAEDTGNNVIEQANRAADLHIKETELKAEQLLSDSRNEARMIIDQADHDAKDLLADMYEEAKELQQSYRTMTSHHESLIKDLKQLAEDTLKQIDSFSVENKTEVLDAQLTQAKILKKAADRVVKITEDPESETHIEENGSKEESISNHWADESITSTEPLEEPKAITIPEQKTESAKSFFDELD